MSNLTRFGATRFMLLLAGPLAAQTDLPLSDDDILAQALTAEIAALSAAASTTTGALATSLGWRDNILLSTFAPVRRAFVRAEIDGAIVRPAPPGWELTGFLTGDVLRYLSPVPETVGEQQWSGQVEARRRLGRSVLIAARGLGFWQDIVQDQSESESFRVIAPTKVAGGHLVLSSSFWPRDRWRVQPWVQVRRHDYRGYNGDYDEPGGGARVEWQPTVLTSLSASYAESRRVFDHRSNSTAGGRPLAATRLHFRQGQGEINARKSGGIHSPWSFTLGATLLRVADQASGYFDYDQRRASAECEWRREPWRFTAWGEAGHTHYRIQTVGTGIAPLPRTADTLETAARIERSFGARWTAFAEHRWDRTRSNLPGIGYRSHTLRTGLRREF